MSRTSRAISQVLRHTALERGLEMDDAGWVAVDDLLELLGIDRPTLEAVVRDNDKQRFELVGDRVRAAQGHSRVPVDPASLEASWTEVTDRTEPLFHGTTRAAAAVIVREGLRPMARTHVHLAGSRVDRVGKRSNVEVLLPVDPAKLRAAGIALWRSPNGVFLARSVPPEAVGGAEPGDPGGR